MRPPNNGRRTRGRHSRRNNSNQQPMRNTVYDSNGPEVRVRGNASQISEKYLSLARDAASAGDTVKMEACYQFAEHYQRLLNAVKEREAAARPAREPREQPNRDQQGRDSNRDRNTRDRNSDRYQDRSRTQSAPKEAGKDTPENEAGTATEIKAEIITNGEIDLSEAEQPKIDMDIESITASITPDTASDPVEAKPAVKRKPRTPRTPSAPRAPRASDMKKPASNEAKATTTKPVEKTADTASKNAFEDTPLPGFLSADGK